MNRCNFFLKTAAAINEVVKTNVDKLERFYVENNICDDTSGNIEVEIGVDNNTGYYYIFIITSYDGITSNAFKSKSLDSLIAIAKKIIRKLDCNIHI